MDDDDDVVKAEKSRRKKKKAEESRRKREDANLLHWLVIVPLVTFAVAVYALAAVRTHAPDLPGWVTWTAEHTLGWLVEHMISGARDLLSWAVGGFKDRATG